MSKFKEISKKELLELAGNITGEPVQQGGNDFIFIPVNQQTGYDKLDIDNFCLDNNLTIKKIGDGNITAKNPDGSVQGQPVAIKRYDIYDDDNKLYMQIIKLPDTDSVIGYKIDKANAEQLWGKIDRTNILDMQTKELDQNFVKAVRGSHDLNKLEKDVILNQEIVETNLDKKLTATGNNIVLMGEDHNTKFFRLVEDMTRKHLADRYEFKSLALEAYKNTKTTLPGKTLGDVIDSAVVLSDDVIAEEVRLKTITERDSGLRKQHVYAVDFGKPEYDKSSGNNRPEEVLSERDKFMSNELNVINSKSGNILFIGGAAHVKMREDIIAKNPNLNVISLYPTEINFTQNGASENVLERVKYAKDNSINMVYTLDQGDLDKLDSKKADELMNMSDKLYSRKLEFEKQAQAKTVPTKQSPQR